CPLNQADAVARVTVGGDVTVHPLPTGGAAPVGIDTGAGQLWFAEIGAGAVGRMTGDGAVTEFVLPDRDARPHAVAADPAGGCWFTEWAACRLGHVDDDGRFTHHELPGGEPHGITIGADGAVWTAMQTGALVRLG